MPQDSLPQPLQNLFTEVNQDVFHPKQNIVHQGSLVAFNYVGQTKHRIHDPYPLVIVSGIYNDKVSGVNLHYLTLPYVKSVVSVYADNPRFSFANIKGDSYIVGAFRSYKRNGISQIKMLDSGFLKNLLSVVRALDIGEIEQMRAQIRNIMEQSRQQPKALPSEEQ